MSVCLSLSYTHAHARTDSRTLTDTLWHSSIDAQWPPMKSLILPPCRGIARKQCRGLDFWGLHIKFGLISLYSLSLFTVRIHLGLGFLRIHLGFKPVTPP